MRIVDLNWNCTLWQQAASPLPYLNKQGPKIFTKRGQWAISYSLLQWWKTRNVALANYWKSRMWKIWHFNHGRKTLRRGSDGLYGSEFSGIRGIIVMCLQSTVCSRNTLEKTSQWPRNLVLYWSVVNLRYFNFEGSIFLLGLAGNFEIVAWPECLAGLHVGQRAWKFWSQNMLMSNLAKDHFLWWYRSSKKCEPNTT